MKTFHFVPYDGFRQAREENARPERQGYSTAARKHVMRGELMFAEFVVTNAHPVTYVRHWLFSTSRKAEEKFRGQVRPRCCSMATVFASGCGERRNDSQKSCLSNVATCFDSPRRRRQTRSIRQMARHYDEEHALAARSLFVVVNNVQSLECASLTKPLVFTTNCKTLVPLRSAAAALLSLDVGFFYLALAISGFCLSARYEGGDKAAIRTEALHHYNIGLNSVNGRLGDERQQHSDGVILSIMGIAVHTLTPSAHQGWCWEIEQPSSRDGTNSPDQWVLHMRAISTILRMRGGVAALDSNVPLRHWLYL